MSGVLVWVGIGVFGAMGSWLRFSVGGAITARRPSDFPLGTFVVNLTGGFILGFLTGEGVTGDALLVFGTGLMGGYTTFSTWMIETERLGEDGELAAAFMNIAVSMLAGLAVAAAGFYLARAIA